MLACIFKTVIYISTSLKKITGARWHTQVGDQVAKHIDNIIKFSSAKEFQLNKTNRTVLAS